MIINQYASDYSIVTPSVLLEKVQQIDEEAIGHFQFQRQKKIQQNTMQESTNAINKSLRRKSNKKKDQLNLKKIVKQQKNNILVRKFIQKLKLNNINSEPVQFQPFEQDNQQSVYNVKGIQISDASQKFLSIMIVLQIIICVFIDTTAAFFPQILQKPAIRGIQYISLTIFTIQLISSCIVIKIVQGRKIQKINAIIMTYFQDGLIIDLAYMIVLIAGMIGDFHYFRLIILMKLPQCFQRIQNLQNLLVNTFYKQQYWGLAKVFLLNFALAHFLSLILLAMSNLNVKNNWLTKFNIDGCEWYQKYVWGYYWGTTIMLTVGFGDITAANFQEAICLVLIETFSCLALAYNINCVGNLITNIKSQDIQKNRNIKTFKLLSTRNNISQDLQIKIHNYIQESTNIKKKFNFQDEHNFISMLPSQIKADFLKQSNKKIFFNLLFLKNLTQKTLLAFAEVIQMKICHPQQIIKKRGELSGLMIMKQGQIGYCTKLNGSEFNNITIQKVCIKQDEHPFIVSLDFISMERCSYQVKSEQYSIIYFLKRDTTIQTLKTGQLDYEHFCLLRDKTKILSTQFEVLECQFCKSNHTKFDCPKIHFIPLKKHVIDKYLHRVKHSKNYRFNDYLRQKKKINAFKQLTNNSRLFQVNNVINKKYTTWKKHKKFQTKSSFEPGAIIQSGSNTCISGNKLSSKIIKSSVQENSIIDQDRRQQIVMMTNIVKDQLLSVLKKQEQVWILECDEVKNFKFYFINSNASKLSGDRTTARPTLL